MAEGVFPKADGDVLYASEINDSYARVIAVNNTPTNTTSTTYATLATHSISATQAKAKYIIVHFLAAYDNSGYTASQKDSYLEILKDSDVIVELHSLPVGAGGSSVYPYAAGTFSGPYVLVGGTDYTIGTGFTIYIKGKITNANAINLLCSSVFSQGV